MAKKSPAEEKTHSEQFVVSHSLGRLDFWLSKVAEENKWMNELRMAINSYYKQAADRQRVDFISGDSP